MRFCDKGSGGSVRFNMMNKPGASTLNDSVEGGGKRGAIAKKSAKKKPGGKTGAFDGTTIEKS